MRLIRLPHSAGIAALPGISFSGVKRSSRRPPHVRHIRGFFVGIACCCVPSHPVCRNRRR
ncbi:hypothetical protein KCP78_23365 [Salmonella enterica subsp. enterica]|nr:hypothetical protein KCP78_23365 [Salmonella enterica subsp. enterica]